MLRCLSMRSAAAHAYSKQPTDGLKCAEVLPTLPLADELEQPPSANQPAECSNVVCGGQHGSFMSGHEASSSMKRCLLGMYLRCVAPIRHSAHDICSTLPARCADLRRFTRSFARMYLLSSNASRVSHRVLTGSRRRCVCVTPSSRHGRGVPEAAVEGTRAWTALGHREVPK